MGTNYYLKGRPACAHCGRRSERGLHIGKSSGGWTFGLRIYPRDSALGSWHEDELIRMGVGQILSLDDWMPLFERYGVEDEYGADVTVSDLLSNITDRSHPNGLRRRHELANVNGYLVAFPHPSYDLVVGEFS